jgi:subtilisin family serine protease
MYPFKRRFQTEPHAVGLLLSLCLLLILSLSALAEPLTVLAVAGSEDSWELLKEAFQSEYPDLDVTINYYPTPELHQMITILANAGNLSSVIMVHHHWIRSFVDQGILEDLSQYKDRFEEGEIPLVNNDDDTPIGIVWPFSRWDWIVCVPKNGTNVNQAIDLLVAVGKKGGTPPPGFAKDELIVLVNTKQFPDFPASTAELHQFFYYYGCELIESGVSFPDGFIIPGLGTGPDGPPRLFHVRITDETYEWQKAQELRSLGPGIYVDLNHFYELAGTPDEWPGNRQWNFHNSGPGPRAFPAGYVADVDIDGPEMWDLRVDGSEVIVALIDTGYDNGGVPAGFWGRLDIGNAPSAAVAAPAHNLWVDPGEDANGNGWFDPAVDNDGVDGDNDKLFDDVIGWDFGDGDNDPHDRNYHGTAVGSVIAALANNDGKANDRDIAGTCWKLRLMILKACSDEAKADEEGNVSLSLWATLQSYVYAFAHGAQILNCSFGGQFSIVEFLVLAGIDLICDDCLVVASAGNGIKVPNVGKVGISNNGPNAVYPASYELPDLIISVGALKWNGNKALFSNFGAQEGGWWLSRRGVDILAPGVDIRAHQRTAAGGGVVSLSGTSFAAPQVSGVAALIWSQNPALTGSQVKAAILQNADQIAVGDGPPAAAVGPFTICGAAVGASCILNGFKAVASQIPPNQLILALWPKLLTLPAGWDVTTLNEVLIKALTNAKDSGLLDGDVADLAIVDVKEMLNKQIREGGLKEDLLPNLKKAVDALKKK